MSRNLNTVVVRKFRGLNVWTSLASVTPDQATALLNVIPSSSGGVEKLRIPTVLGSAGVSAQPTRFKQYNYQTLVDGVFVPLRQVVAQAGVWLFSYDPTWIASVIRNEADQASLYDFIEANNLFFGNNGVQPFKWDGSTISFWGIAAPIWTPGIGATSSGNLTFVNGGRTYQIAYGNSSTGHVSNASPTSAATGNLTNESQAVNVTGSSPDPQVDTLYLFSTTDGGGTYYLNQVGGFVPGSPPAYIVDNTPDANLDFAVVAPTINNVAPQGLYLANFQGRVLIMNLPTEDPQGVAYSGYEWILLGRPEESFPPSNRLHLAIGADDMRGGGGCANGFVFFSKSNQMFFLRGTLQDITTVAPVQLTTFLQQLPWQMGCFSHFSIQSTPQGLVWLAADKTIQIFDGTDQPQELSINIRPILRTITGGTEDNARSAFFKYLERQWYCLAVATNGSLINNLIVVVDLDPNPETNCGIFLSNIESDDIGVVEDDNGMRQLVIATLGIMQKFIALSDTSGGISNPISATAGTLAGYWQSGPFGNDAPQNIKMFRWATVVTDQRNFAAQTLLIGEDNDFRYPTLLPQGGPAAIPEDGKFPINYKGRRAMVLVQFPPQDISANMLELTMTSITVAER